MPKLDISQYEGREQAYVKHCLLEDYLSKWSYIVGNAWDSLIYVDGFAGPWGAKDEKFGDASFGIAARVLGDAIRGLQTRDINVRGACIFIEKKPDAFQKLEAFAKTNSSRLVRTVALRGRFVELIPQIEKEISTTGRNPFKFVFLDQKGWAATPMEKLKPFLRNRSCEVLFNLMTSFLTRFVEHEDRASSYHSLFGRAGVLERIRALPKGTGQREEAAVEEYCISLKQICGFKYVSQAVIVEPGKEKVRYHLVFATNSPRGVEVFKSAETEAARIQDDVRYQKRVATTGMHDLFVALGNEAPVSRITTEVRKRNLQRVRARILDVLGKSTSTSGVPYIDLFCEAMAFPLVTPDDLQNCLHSLEPHIQFEFAGSSRRKKLSTAQDDRVVVVNRSALA
jgi:three-Cys-motif partner protein